MCNTMFPATNFAPSVFRVACMVAFLTLSITATSEAQGSPAPKYLLFHVTVASAVEAAPDSPLVVLSLPPPKAEVANVVQDVIDAIGTTGTSNKLGFSIGPLAFDHTDDQLRRLITDAFDIGLENNVAVGFHIDDSMFWLAREDLWSEPANVEWSDWSGTPSTGRILPWSEPPLKLAPHMCFNSSGIRAEVNRRARFVIGSEIKAGIDRLVAAGEPDLFAGVIAGWETQISTDFDTDEPRGYCALVNSGFSAENPPADSAQALDHVVGDFIGLWATGLAAAGIPKEKIYSHVAFDPQRGVSSVPFSANYQPGFSTYPAPGTFQQIYTGLEQHGNPAWASSEGTNVIIGSSAGDADMETYLARMFNHGASLVNIYAWMAGPPGNPFRTATESPEAVAAYQKFLSGEPLIEAAPPVDAFDLPDKVRRIQINLPPYIQANGPQEVWPLLEAMMQYMQQQDFPAAEQVADQILLLIEPQ